MTTKPGTPMLDHFRAANMTHVNGAAAVREYDDVCAWYDTRIATLEESHRGALTRVGEDLARLRNTRDTAWREVEHQTRWSQAEHACADKLRAEVASLTGALDAAIAAASEWESKARTPRTVPPSHKGVTYDAKEKMWVCEGSVCNSLWSSVSGLIAKVEGFTDADRAPILALKDAVQALDDAVCSYLDEIWRVAEHRGRTGNDAAVWIGLSPMAQKIIDLCQGRAS